MTAEVRGSAKLVLNRVTSTVSGRFAVAVPRAGEHGAGLYNVYYSDSQSTDTNVPYKNLARLKRRGYAVIVTETVTRAEHIL
jgi:hypothetical protein